ncbi:MAG: fructose-1,6-bisphosphatase [Bacteroidales bacterium]|nr:fructose-1,6-bisphosphatase [Bacteroidales bacterium]
MTDSNRIPLEEVEKDLRFLKLLSNNFPTISDASTEIINLEAILNLPKGTEHFLTDLHGEYEAFQHVLKNASGVVRRKVEDIFGNSLRESDKMELCTVIYYPEEKLEIVKKEESNIEDWYRITLHQIIEVARMVSSKYSRSKVRKSLPSDFAYIIEELLHESQQEPDKHDYYNSIINSIINVHRADEFIIAICKVIQRLTIDTLHIVGDIYDRGPGAHIIMDTLCAYHDFDIQWGNHDVLWMGAAAGNMANIANVIRISLRYGSLETLEDGYGINLLPLATFAMEQYGDDGCHCFKSKINDEEVYKDKTLKMMAQMHKAISIVQFKLEGQIINRRPEFDMSSRNLLSDINLEKGTVVVDGVEYPLNDKNFPTLDASNPYELTQEEQDLMEKLVHSFKNSEKLEKHIRCLYSKGSLYLTRNSNLLYHASIPLNSDGSFKTVSILGNQYKGKDLLDVLDKLIRVAYFEDSESDVYEYALDYMWYLWCGVDSPLFNKSKMATFERYFISDKESHKEKKGEYYHLINEEKVCDMILEEFGLSPQHSRIINGHIPVKTTKGETPVRANGKLLVIDGGFSKAYQSETGIAGYTLIYNSHGLLLVQHEPFQSAEDAISQGHDIISTTKILEFNALRMRVRETDRGVELVGQIKDLQKLLVAYRSGLIKEKK